MELHLFNGMIRRIQQTSNVAAGFPEYGITNASKFRRQQPPKGEKGGHLFNGMTPRLRPVSKFPWNSMTMIDQYQQF